jgi:hypothetical protein
MLTLGLFLLAILVVAFLLFDELARAWDCLNVNQRWLVLAVVGSLLICAVS